MPTTTKKIVNVYAAKANFSDLLARAHRGEEITIARAGRPIARLVALPKPAKRQPGLLRGGHIPAAFFQELNKKELKTWQL